MSSGWDEEWYISDSRQFWSELEDILRIPKRPTLDQLDRSMCTCIKFCAEYLYDYLLAPLQLDRALEMILASVLFKFHSTRMLDLIVKEATKNVSPNGLFVVYTLLIKYGHRSPALYRNLAIWRKLWPGMMATLWSECEDRPHQLLSDVPVEAKLRTPATTLMYEVCRVQKLEIGDLDTFDEAFIDHMFELVERTRLVDDESLNYALIKLIVALNEQFMVATLAAPSSSSTSTSYQHHHDPPSSQKHQYHHRSSRSVDKGKAPAGSSTSTPVEGAGEAKRANRVLAVLLRRLGASKTFGENMIFMLNRAEATPEDLCMQLLILKILYLLFTTSGTKEYFYTNDLKVLVDVFIRELSDLPEESEALRHTYLRVLHPLLTNTQLRTVPYKRPHLLRVLRSLIANPYNIREITPTTKRLVDRCLSGEWCISSVDSYSESDGGGGSPVGSGFTSRSLEDRTLNGLRGLSLGNGAGGGSSVSLDVVAEARTRRRTASGDRWDALPAASQAGRLAAGDEDGRMNSLEDVTEGKPLPFASTLPPSTPDLVVTVHNGDAPHPADGGHSSHPPFSPPRRHRSPPPRPASSASFRSHQTHHAEAAAEATHTQPSHSSSSRHSHSTNTASHSQENISSSYRSTSPPPPTFYASELLTAEPTSPASSTSSLPHLSASAPSTPHGSVIGRTGRRKAPPPPVDRAKKGGLQKQGESMRTGWETFG
ncbi:hypothetical protein BDY24DRAFT_389190 [Mrakia frigida]|uniref:DUF2013 domain-containing protein n=1 Tax=Mrakia frigida TaxID=29902 RepID=UPI003FCC1E69